MSVTIFPVAAPANSKITIEPSKTANVFKVSAYGYELKLTLDEVEQNGVITQKGKELGKVRQQKSGKFSAVNTKGGQYNDGLADLCEAIKKIIAVHTGNPYLY